MQPDNNNQPWTPKPYKPDTNDGSAGVDVPSGTQPAQAPMPQPPVAQPAGQADEQEVQIWRHPEGTQPPIKPQPWHVPQQPSTRSSFSQPATTPEWSHPRPSLPPQPAPQPGQLEQSIPLDTSVAPSVQSAPQQQWATPNNPQTPYQKPQPAAYGARMAELPPLANNDASQTVLPGGDGKKQRFILWGIIAILVLVPAAFLGMWFYTSKTNDTNKQQAQQQQEKVTYNLPDLQALGTNPVLKETDVAKLNKADTFYTVLKQAAMKQVVQTKWDVFYTAQKDAARGDNFTMYNTAIDYADKKYTYDENTYSNLGVFQTRCLGDKQYNYNDSRTVTSPSWQPASDSTNCKFNVAAMHLNDGLNTGGLTDAQADAFIRKIKGKGMLDVSNLSLVDNKGKKYLKVDAAITPQKQGKQLYAGMQLLMSAFQDTGLKADKHPYSYFGAGGEGATIQYYVDLSTQLPAYAVMQSTPALDKSGKPQVSTNWSHRYIEYAFPEKLSAANLNDHNRVTFSAWPDH